MLKKIVHIGTLLIPFLTFAQGLTNKQINYVTKNSSPINVNHDYSEGNWSHIHKEIKGKSIILLGELNHGSKENFDTRNDLIKYLHEKEGFNIILFEAGIGELVILNQRKEKYSPEFMTLGFYGIWRTQEFANLMAYIKEKNILMAGYDVQKGGGGVFFPLIEMEAKKKNILPYKYNTLEERFDSLEDELKKTKSATFDSLKPKVDQLVRDYSIFSKALSKEKKVVHKNIMYVNQTIKNRIAYLKYRLDFIKDKNWQKRWVARDSAMANNIIWLKENIFEEEKIIIIGHNFHISKYNKNEEVAGEFLKRKYPNDIYSIGFFVGKGEYASNSGKPEQMDPIDNENLDVRHIINALNENVCFIPMPVKLRKKNRWLFEDVVVNNSFIDLNGTKSMSLAKSFDGIVLIDKTSIPIKINPKK